MAWLDAGWSSPLKTDGPWVPLGFWVYSTSLPPNTSPRRRALPD